MQWSSGFWFGTLTLLLLFELALGKPGGALEAGCRTRSRFCSLYLEPTPIPPATVTRYSRSYYQATVTNSATTTKHVFATVVITARETLTSTVARHTATIAKCNPVATCGAVTISRQAALRAACTAVLQDFQTTSTSVSVILLPTKTVYAVTEKSTIDTLFLTATVYPMATKTVKTKTVFSCITVSAPEQTCHNKGFQYAEYTLTTEDRKNPPAQWNLGYYKSKKPDFNSTRGKIGGYYELYTDKRKKKRNSYGCFADFNNVRGYIYAPQTGTYRIAVPAYNQAAYIWIGDFAFSGYNVSNALIQADEFGHSYEGGPTMSIYLKRGTYTPFRSAYRCLSSYDYSFYFNIRRPDGLVMEGEYSKDNVFPASIYDGYLLYGGSKGYHVVVSNYFVQFGCGADAKKAPLFPDWGNET